MKVGLRSSFVYEYESHSLEFCWRETWRFKSRFPLPPPTAPIFMAFMFTEFIFQFLDFSKIFLKLLVTELCPTLCNHMDCSPPGFSVHGILQTRILEWVAISLLQRIFPTQGSNPGLKHCTQILYHLSYPGSP